MNLAELITANRGTRSDNQLSVDCGGEPTGQRLQQMRTVAPRQFLKPETVRSLARGLQVSESEVVLAVAESLGLDVRRSLPRLLGYLPVSTDRLSDEDLSLIGRIVRRLGEEGGLSDGRNPEAEKTASVTPLRPKVSEPPPTVMDPKRRVAKKRPAHRPEDEDPEEP